MTFDRLAQFAFGIKFFLLLSCLAASATTNHVTSLRVQPISVPQPAREFRAVWVATLNNIDWPSRPGLSAAQQKQELTAILNSSAYAKLNAVILQVRPNCDVIYSSTEPWSETFSGRMGIAPEPFYDPLAFAVAEAHRRGLELHAWFNPFRAGSSAPKFTPPSNHVSRKHPEWIHIYGRYLWLDPGERAAQQYVINTILDVVRRYDIDGVHLDDYFYPYLETNSAGGTIAFQDDHAWKKYLAAGGRLERDNWRRDNIDTFVQNLYQAIKAEKRWVKFGISPFGIWRPGFPAQIKGLDAYNVLYADSRKWLQNGWIDYFAPQLYWPASQKEQSFPVLLQWWTEQNPKGRHLWPGLSAYRQKPAEIANEIRLTRQIGGGGDIFWSEKVLFQNRKHLADELEKIFTQPALVPASPWLSAAEPAGPRFAVTRQDGEWRGTWSVAGAEKVWQWVWQRKIKGTWQTEILPGEITSKTFAADTDLAAISAVNRYGQRSSPTAWQP